jgi:hypothetical protein
LKSLWLLGDTPTEPLSPTRGVAGYYVTFKQISVMAWSVADEVTERDAEHYAGEH